MVKRKLFLGLLVFLFITITNSVFAEQTVYLAKELQTIKSMRKLKQEGKSIEEIIGQLTRENLLKLITPELAQTEFGIKWIESKLNIKYPTVAVCFIGEEVGYGLFTMEEIQESQYIAEYTGEYLKNDTTNQDNYFSSHAVKAITKNDLIKEHNNEAIKAMLSGNGFVDYSKIPFGGIIDAKKEGNAARFAEHFLTEEEITKFGYEIIPTTNNGFLEQDPITTVNSALQPLSFDNLKKSKSEQHMGLLETMLIATKTIKAFEQIGCSYSQSYGYEFSSWPNEPHIFNQDGGVIPRNRYKVNGFSLALHDVIGNTHRAIHFPSKDDHYRWLLEQLEAGSDYIISRNEESKLPYIYRTKQLIEKLSTGRSKITLPCYYIKQDTDKNLFIETLEKIEGYNLNEKEQSVILKMARDSRNNVQLNRAVESFLAKNKNRSNGARS